MRPTKYLALLGALWISLSLVACGGRHDTAAGTPGKSSVATASASVPTSETNALLAKGAALNQAELLRAAQGSQAGLDAGKVLAKAATGSLITSYRFYNTQTGAHFYTTNEAEKQNVQNTLPQFQYEGPAFYAAGAAAVGLSPVYRFYNRQTGVHFYTISEDEKSLVQASLPQFAYEGIAYYASKVAGTDFVPLFRFYLSSKGYHFYSNNASERDNIIATLPQYRFEGVGYYVLGPDWGKAKGQLPHSGVTAAQCYQTGSNALVACSSAGATALNGQQDGHRAAVNPMSYSEVPNPAGGFFARTECVRDNVTGLIWEGKTASGMRAASNTFTNYDDPTQPQRFDGNNFVNPTQPEIDAANNSVGYVNHVNSIALCGFTDWRLPTADELQGIVDYGVAFPGPTLNSAWFPNTLADGYWSSSPVVGSAAFAWNVVIVDGGVRKFGRYYDGLAVRLVRASP